LWYDPEDSGQNRFFADDTDYFAEWNCDPSVGPIRHIRRLGIHPLGTHSPSVNKDSIVLAPDEWSGGFPMVYFARSVPSAVTPGSPLDGKVRMFDIERAAVDAQKDRWFSEVVVDLPGTMFGVAANDGVRGHFIFQQYQIGMKRGGQGDWLPGMGPLANLPGGRSLIPGVLPRMPREDEADADLYPPGRPYAGYPLFGRGPLGLTSIVRANHLKPMPYGESPECVQDNATLFDYRADGRPHAFYVDLYRQTGGADESGRYTGLQLGGLVLPPGALERVPDAMRTRGPNGEVLLKPGYWAFRFDDAHPDLGWQLDPTSLKPIGIHALNYIHGSNALFLTSDWTDSSVSVYDTGSGTERKLVKARATPHAALGEPTGTEDLFLFIGTRAPYRGATFGLDDDVWTHDIYAASAYPIEMRGGRFVAPEVVRAFRSLAGRDPDVASAFRLTHLVREGMSARDLRKAVVAGSTVADSIRSALWEITGRDAPPSEVARWQRHLAAGGDYAGMVRLMAR
jgi:hypothetical protein